MIRWVAVGWVIGYLIRWSAFHTASPSPAEVLRQLWRQPGFRPRHLGVQLPAANGSVRRSHLRLDRRLPLRGEFSGQLILDSLGCSRRVERMSPPGQIPEEMKAKVCL